MRSVRWNLTVSRASSCTSGNRKTSRSPSSVTIWSASSPFPVSNFAHHAQDRMIRRRPERPQEFSEQLWPPSNHLLEVLGHLPSQRQEHIRILSQVLRELPNRRL